MTHPQATSKLAAVNRMLASIGERPVGNLDDTNRLDVTRAVQTLDEATMAFLAIGWWFNTEYEVEITPDEAGEYILTEDIIRLDQSDRNVNRFSNATGSQLVKRGSVLYNLVTRLSTGHTATVKFDIIRALVFDDLPETARAYLALRAAVTYQTRTLGSVKIFQFTKAESDEAYAAVQLEALDYEDLTLAHAPGIWPAMINRS